MDSEVFLATTLGAVVGGMVPIRAALLLRPSEAKRERRTRLYLELVPPAIEGGIRVQRGEEPEMISEAIQPLRHEAMLAGREDRRVAGAIWDAATALKWWLHADRRFQQGSQELDMQRDVMPVLGEYLARELASYHEWLRRSLNRDTLQRAVQRHGGRRTATWATAAQPYLDIWRRQVKPGYWRRPPAYARHVPKPWT